jgi:hypothetical protein
MMHFIRFSFTLLLDMPMDYFSSFTEWEECRHHHQHTEQFELEMLPDYYYTL